jgi:hypothetical protein
MEPNKIREKIREIDGHTAAIGHMIEEVKEVLNILTDSIETLQSGNSYTEPMDKATSEHDELP